MKITFTNMNNNDFNKFIETASVNFSNDKVENGSWKEETALEQSKAAFASLLPDRQETKNNFLKNIYLEENNIGYLWYSINQDHDPHYAYLYEILIFPEYRGKGYGKKAIELCIQEVKELGIDDLWLHVFGHNQGALKLYQRLGFEISDYTLKINTLQK